MRYLVTGATGLIGTALVRQLADAGESVLALTRDIDHAGHLPDSVTTIEGDVTDKDSLEGAFAEADRLFHLAAWFAPDPDVDFEDQAERVNVEGTRNVLELADAYDLEKVVYTSTLGVYSTANAGGPIDETLEPTKPPETTYFRTKWQAHFEVVDPMAAAGLPVVTAVPGFVYGVRGHPQATVRRVFRAYLRGELPVIPRAYQAPFDHVADIAAAHRRAMEAGTPGEDYIITGPTRELEDLFEAVSTVADGPMPRPLPGWLYRRIVSMAGTIERRVNLPGVDVGALGLFAGDGFPVETTKARDELGIAPAPLEDRLADYLPRERERFDRGRGL